jgi:branched-chain amino acid transport system substrate-binding protein
MGRPSLYRSSFLPWACLVLALILTPAPAAQAGERQIRIGVSLGMTGRYAKLAEFQANGFRLWVKHVNARGGMLGRPVRLVLLDDGSDPAAAAKLYRRLIAAERVDLLFAPFSSDITEAVLPVAAEHGFPLIVSGASSDRIWEKGHANVFGLFLPASKLALGFCELLARNGIERVAVIRDAGSFSRDLASGTVRWAERFGLQVVLDEKFPAGTVSFEGLARRARAAGADAVVLASYLDEAVGMRRAFRAIGWVPRAYYVPVGPGTGEYQKALGPDADLVFSTSQWEAHLTERRGRGDPFSDEYRREFGKAPSYFAATAYAAGEILHAAVRQAASLDREAVRDALATMDATSIIGRYGVDRTGLQVRNVSMIIQLQQGRREVVWPPEHRTAAPWFP